MNNKTIEKVITIISFCAFVALNVVPNLSSVCLSIVLWLVGSVTIWKRAEGFTIGSIRVSFLLLGLILSTIYAIVFYNSWSLLFQNQKVQIIAGMFGLNSSFMVTICAIVGGLCAIPLSALFLQRLFDRINILYAEKVNNLISSTKAYYCCVFLSGIAIVFQIIFSFSRAIWTDEAFSLAIIKHSYQNMIALTAADVHPPLYYIILKFCVDTAHLLFADVPVVYFAKLVSVIPFVLFFILSVTKVRKEWGNYVSGMWALASVAMPNLISYGVEIRMYSWGLFFVTIGLLCAYDIVAYRKRASWVIFVACGLAAAYTHYFACIAAGVIYLSLLTWSLLQDRKLLLPWSVAAAATVIGYCPWLTVFFQQAQKVSANYWISSITFSTVMDCIVFMCGNMLIATIVVIVVDYLVRNIIKNECTGWEEVFALTGILIPVGTAVVGILISVIIRPVFIARYMVPGLACLWLGILIANAYWDKINLKAFISVMIIVICTVNIFSFSASQAQDLAQANTTSGFLATHKDAVYFLEDGHDYEALKGMSESPCYQLYGEDSLLHSQVFGSSGSIYSHSELEELINEGKQVIFVETSGGLSVEELLNGTNLTCIDLGNYRIESMVEFYQILNAEE